MLGIYLRDRRVSRVQCYIAEQLYWLAVRPYKSAQQWATMSVLPKHVLEGIDSLEGNWLQLQKVTAIMSHLEGAGLVEVSRPTGHEEIFEVSVTFRGAEYARRLETRLGRLDLWYVEHKDGIAGLGITVIVAALTTLITLWIKHEWS